MKRYALVLSLTIVMIFGFALGAQAQGACQLSLNETSAGTGNIAFNFDATNCNGTVYAYVTNYDTDLELVFASFGANEGANSQSFGYSMAVEEGSRIFLNLYHMGTGGRDSATWSGSASGGAVSVTGAGGCGSDGRLNSDSCGGDNFAAYVSSSDNGSTVQVWQAEGELAFNVAPQTIASTPEQVETNTLVSASADETHRLYKLTSGEYQLMVRKPDGKTSVMIFNLPFDGNVTTREE